MATRLPPDAARRKSRQRFGSTRAAGERFHESHRLVWLDQLLQDVRYGIRALARYPIACAVAVLSLACGIGAATATLTVRDVLFRKPPPLYREPGQLSRVQVGTPQRPLQPTSGVPGALVARWRVSAAGASLAAAAPRQFREFRRDDRADSIRVQAATANLFAVLGVQAALGAARLDDRSVVLSDRLWRTIFDGRSDVVGQVLWIDGRPLIVAGVMPERFWFSSTDSAAWTLLEDSGVAAAPTLDVVARRVRAVTPSMLAARLQADVSEYAAALPSGEREVRLAVSGIEGTPMGRAVSVALPWALATAVLLTLLIASANVAILVIAQWTVREREIAIRASLGATRSRLVRALVSESLVIAAMGGALGVAITLALMRLIVARAGGSGRFFDFAVEPHILVDAFVITILAGVVSGAGPALLETRRLHTNPILTLAASERVRQRWRNILVVAEIAVTIGLLVVSGAMLGAYQKQLSRDLGFSPHALVAVRVQNDGGVPIARVRERVAQLAGVAAVAAASAAPYMGAGSLDIVAGDASGESTVRAERIDIDPPFFDTLGVALRAGRAFTNADAPETRTAIVNEFLAARLFPGADAVGRQVWVRGSAHEIVGVVAQYLDTALQPHDFDAKLYLPLHPSRTEARQIAVIVRAAGDPAALARSLRQEIRRAAAGNSVTSFYTLDQVMEVAAQETLVGTAPLLPLVAVGLLLTAAGVYGVLAFAVARRSRELALRVAIGAAPRDIVRLVTKQSLRLLVAGIGVGIGVTFALSRVLQASGGGGSFLDPPWPAFLVPVVLVAAIGAAATIVPTRRARRVDPAVLLRTN